MRDPESALIDKVSLHGGSESLIAQGVDEQHFADEDNAEVFKFLKNHIRKYKTPPSPDIVKEKFPERKWEIVTDPLEFIQERFVVEVKRNFAIDSYNELGHILQGNKNEDIARIDEIFIDSANQLAKVIPASNVARFSEMPIRILNYRQRKEEGVPPGIPFGIPSLDDLTLGIQPHEYVTVAGFTGVGKSTLALVFCINHYLNGYTPMIISLEMGADELFRKLDAIAAGLRQHALKAMNLSGHELKAWEETAEKVDKFQADKDIIVVDPDFATPEKIYAETSRWSPDIVLIDYVQLLTAPSYYRNTWEKIGYVSQMMKAMARQLEIPVYGLAQTNTDSADEGARLKNLAGSRDIGKHSDIVLALHQDEEMAVENKLEIRVEKNRGGPKGKVYMLFDHEKAQYREWNKTSDDYRKTE